MIALVHEEAREKRQIGLARSTQRKRLSCACGTGIRTTWDQISAGTAPTKCAQCLKRETRTLRVVEPPSILDEIPGTGRCRGGVDAAKACGITWGNLDHRHCPCGEPIAAYWMPEVDRASVADETQAVAQRRRQRGANGRLIPLPPLGSNFEIVEGCCGKCELRNLPLSLKVFSERAVTEGHLPAPRTSGRARISPPRLATDLASTPRTGGLV